MTLYEIKRAIGLMKLDVKEKEEALEQVRSESLVSSAADLAREKFKSVKVATKFIEAFVDMDDRVKDAYLEFKKSRSELAILEDNLLLAQEAGMGVFNEREEILGRMSKIISSDFDENLKVIYLDMMSQVEVVTGSIESISEDLQKERMNNSYAKHLVDAAQQLLSLNEYYEIARKMLLITRGDRDLNEFIKSEQQYINDLRTGTKLIHDTIKMIMRNY